MRKRIGADPLASLEEQQYVARDLVVRPFSRTGGFSFAYLTITLDGSAKPEPSWVGEAGLAQRWIMLSR